MSNKELLKDLYFQALSASLPKNFIHRYCSLQDNILTIKDDQYNLSQYKNIYLFGSGKAAFMMAKEMEEILQEKVRGGLIVTPSPQQERLQFIDVCESSHPIPTQKSIDCAHRLSAMISRCGDDDLYIYLLSGGSSSLIEIPKEPITLQDLQKCTDMMLKNSIDIHKINIVRKHLSKIKGGKLTQLTKAQGIVLVVSDVIGDNLDTIGSAPLYPDHSTIQEAKKILQNASLFEIMPESIRQVLSSDDPITRTVIKIPHYILASNELALQAAYKAALKQDLKPLLIKKPMSGDVTQMAKTIIQTLNDFPKRCIIFGGECTVDVKVNGQGGRNQHLTLLMLQYICQHNHALTFLSAGTDGIDGNSKATGSVIDFTSCQKTRMSEIEQHLKNFDSYKLLKSTDDLIVTGNSGTNVMDIAIALQR